MTDIKPSHDSDNPILRFAEALDRSIAQRRRELGLEPVSSLLLDLNALMRDPRKPIGKPRTRSSAKRRNDDRSA
jgi:hypothetical protein